MPPLFFVLLSLVAILVLAITSEGLAFGMTYEEAKAIERWLKGDRK